MDSIWRKPGLYIGYTHVWVNSSGLGRAGRLGGVNNHKCQFTEYDYQVYMWTLRELMWANSNSWIHFRVWVLTKYIEPSLQCILNNFSDPLLTDYILAANVLFLYFNLVSLNTLLLGQKCFIIAIMVSHLCQPVVQWEKKFLSYKYLRQISHVLYSLEAFYNIL